MSTQAIKTAHAEFISIQLNIEAPDVMAIGSRMQEINEEAYMNGYNWSAFVDHYLGVNYPELRAGLEGDSEAGTFVALYENNPTGSKKADQLVAILNQMVAAPEAVYAFLQEEGDGVEWD